MAATCFSTTSSSGVLDVIVFIVLPLFFTLILAFFLYWRFWFGRQPRRAVPPDERTIVSPANGKLVVIRKFDVKKSSSALAKKWNGGSVDVLCKDVAPKGWFVLIMMTPLNVHYQRAPIAGRVVNVKYVKGKFLNAVKNPERLLTLENEKNEITFQGARGKVKVVQIAGVLARRIRAFVAKNDKVEKGGVVGFINLGSQVAIVLPESVKLNVKVGDVVIDGETIIAKYR